MHLPSSWGCGRCSSTVLGGIIWKGGEGAVLGSSSGREAGCPSGSAVPSLWIRGFGDSSGFSHDAQGYRVHLAVCNFVGLQVDHLLTSVTLR